MAKTVKTAITIPREEFKIVEAVRKKIGKSRSQIIVEALRLWLASRRVEEMERSYEEGYRKKPECLAEIDALMKAGAPATGTEQW